MTSKSLVNVKKQPLKRITRFDAMRKNHEAFHFEIGDYKITIRFEYIGDMGVVHHILGNGKTYKRYAKDKVGMVYRTYKYYIKTKSYKTTKGYKFEPIGAEYAKLFGIYKEPDFISVTQAMKEINAFREGVDPFQRMTTKYK